MPHPILGSHEGDWLTVTTPKQARLLNDASALRMLEPFISRTLGAAEAAREAGVSVERLSYRLKQFLDASLLAQVGERQRRGRAVRLYRAPGGYVVPFHLTPFEDIEAQLRANLAETHASSVRALARVLQDLSSDGRLLYRDDRTGRVFSESASGEGDPDFFLQDALLRGRGGQRSTELWLDEAQRAELLELYVQLNDRVLAWEAERKPGAQKYLLSLTMVPLDDES